MNDLKDFSMYVWGGLLLIGIEACVLLHYIADDNIDGAINSLAQFFLLIAILSFACLWIFIGGYLQNKSETYRCLYRASEINILTNPALAKERFGFRFLKFKLLLAALLIVFVICTYIVCRLQNISQFAFVCTILVCMSIILLTYRARLLFSIMPSFLVPNKYKTKRNDYYTSICTVTPEAFVEQMAHYQDCIDKHAYSLFCKYYYHEIAPRRSVQFIDESDYDEFEKLACKIIQGYYIPKNSTTAEGDEITQCL